MSDSEKGIEKKEGGSEHINLKVVGNVSKKLIIGRELGHLRTPTLRASCLNLETDFEISALAAPSCSQMPYEIANCV